ncbi:MAG TPA: DNA polymerase III subunit alpha [Solirubrobacteraceae bacterium]|jgi:DNA polymerase-3 subunit alpha
MSEPTCAHLHVHSEYSLLDGASKIEGLVERAASFGQPALGLTDHGVMNGAVELHQAARKAGIKPIVGCEVYFVDDHAAVAAPGQRLEHNHLTLLASSDEGYRNLVQLSSIGFLEGVQRGKPTVDMDQISRYGGGLIALTGCLASRLCSRIADGRIDEGRAHVDTLIEVLGRDNVYFEVQKNGLTQQDRCNEEIVRMAADMGGSLVATADVHYLRREDYSHHAALLCVQTKSTLAEPKIRFETNEFYLKDSAEMAASFAQWPEALASTLEIAERCNVEIELDRQLIPAYPVPEGESESSYLRKLVLEGLRERYGDPPPAATLERMETELEVIERMGFNAYFLIVWDFVNFAKNNGVAVGPGRGSAAGSIVAYSLRITDVDPLAYGLLFERFLNPERVSMPDIDIDFSVRGRERVLRYVVEKYGRDSVAQIITFGKMAPRQATRDAARVLGHDYGVGDRLAKLIPDPQQGRAPSFEECLADGEPLRAAYDEDQAARSIIDTARGLEGVVRNSSIHAAAVVIADRPLTDIVPLQIADAGVDENGERQYRTVTQFSMKPIEQIGLLKMDFLGLRNLDVIEDALDIIERSTGVRPDMATLPLDDPATYEMLARGDSVGVFQFESEGMREALKKVRPDRFDDLVALNALYRPGAMDQIPTYARGKHRPEAITYPDERLRSILSSSMGVILYQEQAMQVAKDIAGFSGAKADDLRKAIGKKNRAAMAQLKPEFVSGARASGTSDEVIDFLWNTNERSADYSFNRSHAACYGLIAYRTAWLKANHPAEYMAALISSVMSTKDRVPFFVARCEDMGIEILPPDVNLSGHEFIVVERNIRFGLDAVKGVGYQAVEAIIRAREEGGPFSSLWDFCERVDGRTVNKKAIEALIKCGALGSTGATRRGMLEVLEQAQGAGQKAQQDALIGQASIFDLGEVDAPANGHAAIRPPIPTIEFEQGELLAVEKEAIGLFISAHPLKAVREALAVAVDFSLSAVRERPDKETVTIGGIITQARKIRTRSGTDMMFATLDDLEDQLEIIVFGSALEKCEESLGVDSIVTVKGRVDQKEEGRTTVVAQTVEPFRPDAEAVARARAAALEAARPKPVHIRLGDGARFATMIEELRGVLGNFPGGSEVVIELSDHRRVRLGNEFRVAPTPGLRAELEHVLGGPVRLVA